MILIYLLFNVTFYSILLLSYAIPYSMLYYMCYDCVVASERRCVPYDCVQKGLLYLVEQHHTSLLTCIK